jgi:hypothetical protein
MYVYILVGEGEKRAVESQMMCQQIGTKSLNKQLALAGFHYRIVIMQTKPLRGFKRQP